MRKYEVINLGISKEFGIMFNEGSADRPKFKLLATATEDNAKEVVEKLNRIPPTRDELLGKN